MIKIGGKHGEQENIYYIKDTGIGFSMNKQDRLFKMFERLHSKTEYEGSGLGLVVVDRIVKQHGGKVWAEGKPGEGATFYFSLPN